MASGERFLGCSSQLLAASASAFCPTVGVPRSCSAKESSASSACSNLQMGSNFACSTISPCPAVGAVNGSFVRSSTCQCRVKAWDTCTWADATPAAEGERVRSLKTSAGATAASTVSPSCAADNPYALPATRIAFVEY